MLRGYEPEPRLPLFNTYRHSCEGRLDHQYMASQTFSQDQAPTYVTERKGLEEWQAGSCVRSDHVTRYINPEPQGRTRSKEIEALENAC
jgi:hypothetical protein